jgi:predicted  nucleic acid-binding Zn-ribbon protein
MLYTELGKKVTQLEERIARIEGIMEQMSERLNHIDTEISELRKHIDSEIGELRGSDRWIIGLLFFMWVTMIVSIWLSR